MGHVNFGKEQGKDKKGLLRFEEVGTTSTYRWNISKIPVHDSSFRNWHKKEGKITFPAVFKAELELTNVGDTFLDMSSYRKGYVSVNGYLLGRYWDFGPQERLFCPGVWLR